MRIIALILALSIGASSAHAAQRITFDPGGVIQHFIERFITWRLANELVVVDGMCISACTLVTALIQRERVCATPYARLAFHSAVSINMLTGERRFAREATRLMWRLYPQNVRDLLMRHGWQDGMEHEELIYIEGAELHSIIRPCTPADMLELRGVAAVNE